MQLCPANITFAVLSQTGGCGDPRVRNETRLRSPGPNFQQLQAESADKSEKVKDYETYISTASSSS